MVLQVRAALLRLGEFVKTIFSKSNIMFKRICFAIFFSFAVFSCYSSVRSEPIVSNSEKVETESRPFSEQANFMSSVGFARWQYFQRNGKWPPKIVEAIVASSPAYGGFYMPTFLSKLQEEIRRHPHALIFRASWHIDTIGPDWQDNYLITYIYNRSAGVLYPQQSHILPRKGLKLTSELIPQLLHIHREAAKKTKNADKAEEQMMEWWKVKTQ